MNPTVWITHPETQAVAEVPSAALPMYRQSGWDVLSDEELDELERTRAAEIDAAERDMQQKAAHALQPAPPAETDERTPEELTEIGEAALAAADTPTAEEAGAVPGPFTDDQIAVAEEQPEKDAAGRRTKKGND